MQKLPLPFAAGDAVFARGERWVVEETTAFEDCVLLHLAEAGGAGARRRARLLHPFDRPVVTRTDRRIGAVTRRRWVKNLQSHLADVRTHGQLRSARSAAIDIFPFQLEPALALLRGRAARVLLADEVGLGKTIQAGLMLAELQQRGWCDRALILCPAGLCRQWADELQRRFQIAASIFDAPSLRRFTAALPFGVNPWSVEPVAITSIDFIKQPEVLRAVTSLLWDIFIIDEAHQAATAPQRSAAVTTLARRARHVVLVTATPHAGDEAAYRSLCSIGQIDGNDPLLLFRRTRETVGMKRTRKVHLLPVRSGPHEIDMHRLLADYAKRLWQIGRRQGAREAQLVAMVLSKRAMSSASSLATSVERRLACLPGSGSAAVPLQSGLPFGPAEPAENDEDADAEPVLAAPGFDRVDEEEATLRAILAAAERARDSESKARALVRLLRRAPEPAIVFTEYRDTLAMLERSVQAFRRVALLHGGLSLAERRSAVHAFNTGAADLLLATDAGSEGLNLQSRCRLVINLELPWNPIRLEQRIGRVDRIGQSRTVHAINLFADGTAEATVLANLHKRLQRMRASEIEIAACVIDGRDTTQLEAAPEDTTAAITTVADLKKDAEAEAVRLSGLRNLSPSPLPHRDDNRTAVCVFRSPVHKITRSPGVLCIFRARIVNGSGRLVEEMLVPVQLPLSRSDLASACAPDARRRDVRARAEYLVERFGAAVASAAHRHVEQRTAEIAAESRDWVARTLVREQQLSQVIQTDSVLFQAGLFETRSLRQREDHDIQQQRWLDEIASRAGHLELGAVASPAQAPALVLLLLQC